MGRLILLSVFVIHFFGQGVRAESVSVLPIEAKEILNLARKSSASLTVINFWASWCPPCRHEFPDLLKFKAAWKSKSVGFEFVSVDFEADIADTKAFLSESKVDFPTYIRSGDDQGLLRYVDPKWHGALPTTFVVNQTGKILFRFDGPITYSRLETKVSELLKLQAKPAK